MVFILHTYNCKCVKTELNNMATRIKPIIIILIGGIKLLCCTLNNNLYLGGNPLSRSIDIVAEQAINSQLKIK